MMWRPSREESLLPKRKRLQRLFQRETLSHLHACSIGDKSGERDGRSSKIIWTVQKTPYLLPYENEHRLASFFFKIFYLICFKYFYSNYSFLGALTVGNASRVYRTQVDGPAQSLKCSHATH